MVFTVRELFPACRTADRFTVAGHVGVNRVAFDGIVSGKTLPAGTYRITAQTGSIIAATMTVVIVERGPPSAEQLAAARRRNRCGSAMSLGTNYLSGTNFIGKALSRTGGSLTELLRSQNPAELFSPGSLGHPSVLSSNGIAKAIWNPFVIAALAAAAVLFGLAALPQSAMSDSRLTDLLARHRLEVGMAGAAALTAALTAVLVALALG